MGWIRSISTLKHSSCYMVGWPVGAVVAGKVLVWLTNTTSCGWVGKISAKGNGYSSRNMTLKHRLNGFFFFSYSKNFKSSTSACNITEWLFGNSVRTLAKVWFRIWNWVWDNLHVYMYSLTNMTKSIRLGFLLLEYYWSVPVNLHNLPKLFF